MIEQRFITESTIAVALGGSHARGDPTQYSDIDLWIYEPQPKPHRMEYVDGQLLSVSWGSISQKRSDFEKPETAIWAVPGVRTAKILYDPTGAFAELQQAAQAFRWEPLQEAANKYASGELVGYAEEAHKILSGLQKNHPSTMLYGSWGMVQGMAAILLVQRGTLIPTENQFIDKVLETAGEGSPWAEYYRVAIGLKDGLPAQERAIASLALYRETIRVMNTVIEPKDRVTISQVLSILDKADIKG